jgi:SAM-dependent methyltransferase
MPERFRKPQGLRLVEPASDLTTTQKRRIRSGGAAPLAEESPVSFVNGIQHDDEVLREKGFEAVRVTTGEYLARPHENGGSSLDVFMDMTGQYAAIMVNWLKLRSLVPDINRAGRVLDATCGTGMVTRYLLHTGNEGLHIVANEVSPDLNLIARSNLAEFARKRDGKAVTMASIDLSRDDLAREDAVVKPAMFDIVLWWGSFQTLASRGAVMTNAFDLLREGGRFIIMDVYPWLPLPYGVVGSEGAKLMAFISRPLDMSEDVTGWVRDKWIARVAEADIQAAADTRVEVVRLAEVLRGPGLPPDYWGEMRCLCFKKPS